jgi:hypothetical protein
METKNTEQKTDLEKAIELFKYQKESFMTLAQSIPCSALLKGTVKPRFYDELRSIGSLPASKRTDEALEAHIRTQSEDSYAALVNAVKQLFTEVQEKLRTLSELQDTLKADDLYKSWCVHIRRELYLFKHFLFGLKALTPVPQG